MDCEMPLGCVEQRFLRVGHRISGAVAQTYSSDCACVRPILSDKVSCTADDFVAARNHTSLGNELFSCGEPKMFFHPGQL
jgi:hypothetical protein